MSDTRDSKRDRGGLRQGLLTLAELVPRRDLLERTRAFQWLGRLAQAAVDAPVAVERLRHALSPHALHPPRFARNGDGAPTDLRSEVTVCMATVRRSTFPAAAAALSSQDALFQGPTLIEHVSPWPRAFGRMVDLCETPFLVQVDEDMILKPYAVRFLVERMRAAPADVAMLCAPLWDSHLRRVIQGVKVWRHAALTAIQKQESAAPSIDLIASLEAAGLRVEVLMPRDYLDREVQDDPNREEVLGEHRVVGKKLLFDRFYSVFSTYQSYAGMHAAGQDLGRFLERLGLGEERENPDLWALLGAVAGLANPAGAADHYRRGQDLPGFRLLRPLVLRGPEEVGLLLGAEGVPDAGPDELRRLLELYDSIRIVRLLGDPLGRPNTPLLIGLARSNDLELACEHPASRDAAPADLRPLASAGAAELVLVRAPNGALSDETLNAARSAALSVRVRVEVDRAELHERREALTALLQRAQRLADAVDVFPPLPRPGCNADSLRAEDAATRAAWDDLRADLEGVRFGSLLDDQAESACDSPFRGLVVDGAGGVSGCLAGAIPPMADPTIYQATAEALWFEHELRELRSSLSGLSEPNDACRRCPHRGGER